MSEELVDGEEVVKKHPAPSQQLFVHLVPPHSHDSEKKNHSDSKSATKSDSTQKKSAPPVITEKEMGRMMDMGLGRGVDATDASPWVSKSSFQVRRVMFDCVIGTEEGGALQSYDREISSVQSQQSNLKASIAVPQAPFTIGVDAEHSRSVSTTRRAVGKKVVNRTISFRADFEDLPQSITTDPSSAIRDAIPTATYRASVEGSTLTFEERLAKWILEYINHKIEVKSKHKGKLVESSFEMTGNPIDDIASLIHESTNDDVRKMILAACREFVQVFRVTHYVSAIELGASEYQVLCETEYFSQRKAGKIIGVVSLANQAASLSSLWKKTKKASDLKRIGRIDNDRVERGSYDEAVVGVSIQPICNLVRLRYLQLTLKKALLEYVETQGDSTAGPYLIACDDDRMFWMVNPDNNYAVEATRDIKQASAFFVFPNEDGGHPYEFNIGYYDDDRKVRKRKASILSASCPGVDPIPRYLHTPVNIIGGNFGPLHMKNYMLECQSRLTLHSRLLKHYNPVDITPWVSGRDAFFINCARRRVKRDGYICVKLVAGQRGGRPELRTGCVPTKRRHNERNTWMLFRLLPISLRNKPVVPAGDRNEPDVLSNVDVELAQYGALDFTPEPQEKSSGAAVNFKSGSKTAKLLPSPNEKPLEKTAESTPLPGAAVELQQLASHQQQ